MVTDIIWVRVIMVRVKLRVYAFGKVRARVRVSARDRVRLSVRKD